MAVDPSNLSRQILRISGLSSGIDTESVVTSLLATDQSKIDKQFQLQTKLEWKQDAYREVNLMVKNFREEYMSVLNSDGNMLSDDAYRINEVTMLDTTSAVTISADSTAETGQMTINSITQLAEAAKMSSTGAFLDDTMLYDTALSDLNLDNALQFVSGEISFSINGETFTFAETDTIGNLLNEVNANADTGVKMTYSNLTKGFKLTNKNTGSDSEITLANITGNAFSAVDSAFGIDEGTVLGQDAMLTIENIAVVKSTNSFSIDGITYSLNDVSATAVDFNIDRNIDEAVDKIKSFITGYNELIGELQSKLDEDVFSTYTPLTSEQRSALSESEAEKWDEASKSGLLRNDSYINTLLSSMRSAFYTSVESTGKSPADIGLKTSSYYEQGKITIDETTLRTALENNPDEVISLFTATSTAEDYTDKYNESGLVTRISTAMLDYTDTTVEGSIALLSAQISEAEERMDTLVDRYYDREDALWSRFTAMETALATLNSQSSWLSSMFSSSSE